MLESFSLNRNKPLYFIVSMFCHMDFHLTRFHEPLATGCTVILENTSVSIRHMCLQVNVM